MPARRLDKLLGVESHPLSANGARGAGVQSLKHRPRKCLVFDRRRAANRLLNAGIGSGQLAVTEAGSLLRGAFGILQVLQYGPIYSEHPGNARELGHSDALTRRLADSLLLS